MALVVTLRVWVASAAAIAVFLLVAVVLIATAPSPGVAAASVGIFAAIYVLFVLLAIVLGRDAQRHGKDGWLWASHFLFSPVIFGIAYLIRRHREPQSVYPTWVPDEKVSDSNVYRMYKWWPTQIKATLAIFAALGGLLVWISAVGATGPGWGFTRFWLFGVCYMAYGFLWRVA